MSCLRRPLGFVLLGLLATPWVTTAQDVSGAGFYPFRGSARTVGLAGAYTALSNDVGGLHFNPAGMAQIETRQAGVNLKVNSDGEDYFGLAYVEPIRSGKIGGGFSYFRASDGTGRSDKVYQYTYGQYFADGVAVGLNVRYHEVDTAGANDEGFAVDLGAIYQPPNMPEWQFGLAALDINEPSFTGIGLSKRVYNIGAAYMPDELTTFALDWYDVGSSANRGGLRFGAERQLTDNITIRGGVAEDTFSVGLTLMWKYFHLDYGFMRVDDGADVNMFSLVGNF